MPLGLFEAVIRRIYSKFHEHGQRLFRRNLHLV